MRIYWAALVLLAASPAGAVPVRLDTASARGVISALGNPGLTRADALTVARLPGNLALVRKLVSYHLPATPEALADDLVAAAHGQVLVDNVARALNFVRVREKSAALTALLNRIERDPASFQGWVSARVGLFAPPGAAVQVTLYLIAGGNSGGFAFDDPATYLNIAYFDAFEVARSVAAHELYHGVQDVLMDADERKIAALEPSAFQGSEAARQCLVLTQFFASLYDEGTASLVGDPMALDVTSGPLAAKTHDEFAAGLASIRRSVTVLELSVDGLTGPNPPAYDDVYAVGFYVPEILYKLGYIMAQDIVAADGEAGLAGLLTQRSVAFSVRYMALPLYGKDKAHPRLGQNTEAAVRRLAAGCPVVAAR